MAENKTITLPDVGDFDDIEIIEVLIAIGDEVEAEQSIIVLESDKATMGDPEPFCRQNRIDRSQGRGSAQRGRQDCNAQRCRRRCQCC